MSFQSNNVIILQLSTVNGGNSSVTLSSNDIEDNNTSYSSKTKVSPEERSRDGYSAERLPSINFRSCARGGFVPNSVVRTFIEPQTPSNFLPATKIPKEDNFLKRFQKGKLSICSSSSDSSLPNGFMQIRGITCQHLIEIVLL